ncbi:MAG: hypothetical protein M1839_003095 [Geoglossum umbratile]|nr:MAG: hypothetical protein M1839_003095 [Geoglossum umbratile]
MATPFSKRGSCVPPDVNQATIDLMLDYEKCKPNPYNNDGAHTWTIGCGHKCNQGTKCTELPYPIPLSDANMRTLFTSDLQPRLLQLNILIKNDVQLNDNQYGALADLLFNEGYGNLAGSALITRLNNHEDPAVVIPQEFPKFNKAEGVENAGLKRRRQSEIQLAQKSSTVRIFICDKDGDGDAGDPDEGSE